jgi:hypothetical protein
MKGPMALSFINEKNLPQYGKKSSIFIFSIFDFGPVIFFAFIKGHIAQLFY